MTSQGISHKIINMLLPTQNLKTNQNLESSAMIRSNKKISYLFRSRLPKRFSAERRNGSKNFSHPYVNLQKVILRPIEG